MKFMWVLLAMGSLAAGAGCASHTNHVVDVADAQRVCAIDADCGLTVLACAGCDVAVSRSAIPALQAQRRAQCRRWEPVEILCPPPERAVCRANRCTTEPVDADE